MLIIKLLKAIWNAPYTPPTTQAEIRPRRRSTPSYRGLEEEMKNTREAERREAFEQMWQEYRG